MERDGKDLKLRPMILETCYQSTEVINTQLKIRSVSEGNEEVIPDNVKNEKGIFFI